MVSRYLPGQILTGVGINLWVLSVKHYMPVWIPVFVLMMGFLWFVFTPREA